MRPLLTFLLILFTTTLFAQEKKYFNSNWQKVVNEKTLFARQYKHEKTKVIVEDFFNDNLLTKAEIYGLTEENDIDEFLQYSYTTLEEHYRDYFKYVTGFFTKYQGKNLSEKKIIKGKSIKYLQIWNYSGKEILVKGTGEYSHPAQWDETIYEIYVDSILVKKYGLTTVQKDTIHYILDRIATPKEGLPDFLEKLSKNIKYPKKALKEGKEGLVRISFIVDENGKLMNIEALSSIGFNFEENVILKLEKLSHWYPATYKGRFVKSRLTLPVKFKIPN